METPLVDQRIFHLSVPLAGVVPECPRYGSDGESEVQSGGSEEVVTFPTAATTPFEHVVVRRRPKTLRTDQESSITPGCPSSQRRFNVQDISKRLSLPADLNVPESFLAKHNGPGQSNKSSLRLH